MNPLLPVPDTFEVDPDQILMQAIGFTPEDLAANQEGYLTKAQRRRLYGERRVWIAIGVFGIGCDILLTALVANSRLWSASAYQRLPVMVLLLAFGLFFVFVWFKQRKLQEDLYKGEVGGFEYTMKPWWSFGDRGRLRYYVPIKHERILITRNTYLALSAHDYSYYVYCTAHAKKLLSFERLVDDAE